MLRITPNISFTHNVQNNETLGSQNLLSSSSTPMPTAYLEGSLLLKRVLENKEPGRVKKMKKIVSITPGNCGDCGDQEARQWHGTGASLQKCQSCYNKAYYQENRDKICPNQEQKKSKRTYSQKSKDTRRLWELSNKDKRSAQNRAYNAKHKKEIDEHAKIYYAINKDKVQARKKSRQKELKAKTQGSEGAKKTKEDSFSIGNFPQERGLLLGQTSASSPKNIDDINSVTEFLNNIFDDSESDFSGDEFLF